MKQRVLIVSNRLPVSIREEGDTLTVQHSNGGLATALSSVMDQYNARWLGWAGTKKPLLPGKLRSLEIDKRLKPVNIPATHLAGFYERMANGILWPLLHGIEPVMAFDEADWKDYVKVNQRFARDIKRVSKPEDVIWLHDYHLLLVPQLLREAGLTNRIGFFLHTPFRPGDLLSYLPEYRQLLQSLTEVDVLGMQTKADVAAFKAVLEQEGIAERPGTLVQDFPIGVDFEAFSKSQGRPAVQAHAARIEPLCAGKQVVLSVSRLDYTKGIIEQLRAFEALLDRSQRPQVYLYKIVVAPSREDAPGYRELKYDIELHVQRINNKFARIGHRPIHYTYRNCDFDELNAWYGRADALLVTPIIDGMNLVAKEFVAARNNDHGVLILSNTIGAAQQLREALQVAPRDIQEVSRAIETALAMPAEERRRRWQALRRNVQLEDVFWWVQDYMHTLVPLEQNATAGQTAKNVIKYLYGKATGTAS